VRIRAALAASAALPLVLQAHGFEEKHDLPAPLGHFVLGAVLAVALSFALAAVFARRKQDLPLAGAADRPSVRLPAWLVAGLRLAGLLLFAVVLVAAFAGTADPVMNVAPTFVWIVWWVGLSLVAACVCDLWPLLDPWATLFDAADGAPRRLGLRRGIALDWHWPAALGMWPAAALLLAWSWLEVVYPLAAVPARIGWAAVAWSVLTLTGMVCFGRQRWQRHGDVFAIYFALLGRMAPAGLDAARQRIALRVPGSALVSPAGGELPAGGVAFVLAMLSTVLFDGLHASQAWPWFEGVLARLRPHGAAVGAELAGTLGLVLVWLVFLAAYAHTCRVAARLAGRSPASRVARDFAPTLVPIAVGYNVAHNFSSLVEQGQNMLSLASDPFGWGWNLLGSAQLHSRSGIVDARMTWHVAIGAVVLGHCIGVWLAHRVALRHPPRPAAAVRAALPLVLLMLAYTAVSLFVIADPMVQYQPP
jgi:hypothetical protein